MKVCLFYRPINGWLLLLMLGTVCSAYAEGSRDVDRLTQQWLDIDRQVGHLQSDWQSQKPVLEQRLALLTAEKKQLQEILLLSNEGQDDVAARRTELLAQQSHLESQQQTFQQAFNHLLVRIRSVGTLLPPPLARGWADEQAALGENPEISLQLQVALAQLSKLAEFDHRVALHEMPINLPDHGEVMVRQLYLGVGMAWFVSADGQFSGWGQADDGNWVWHLEDSATAAAVAGDIARAIAIFERRRQADFVRLPMRLAQSATLGSADEVKP